MTLADSVAPVSPSIATPRVVVVDDENTVFGATALIDSAGRAERMIPEVWQHFFPQGSASNEELDAAVRLMASIDGPTICILDFQLLASSAPREHLEHHEDILALTNGAKIPPGMHDGVFLLATALRNPKLRPLLCVISSQAGNPPFLDPDNLRARVLEKFGRSPASFKIIPNAVVSRTLFKSETAYPLYFKKLRRIWSEFSYNLHLLKYWAEAWHKKHHGHVAADEWPGGVIFDRLFDFATSAPAPHPLKSVFCFDDIRVKWNAFHDRRELAYSHYTLTVEAAAEAIGGALEGTGVNCSFDPSQRDQLIWWPQNPGVAFLWRLEQFITQGLEVCSGSLHLGVRQQEGAARTILNIPMRQPQEFLRECALPSNRDKHVGAIGSFRRLLHASYPTTQELEPVRIIVPDARNALDEILSVGALQATNSNPLLLHSADIEGLALSWSAPE